MTYMEIEPTLVYCWDIGNKITTVYVDYVGVDHQGVASMRASRLLETRNNRIWGWMYNASFNREEAVKELRNKIRKEYDAATKKVEKLRKQYNEAN